MAALSTLSRYDDNPFIRALNKPLTTKEFFAAIRRKPTLDYRLLKEENNFVRKLALNQLHTDFYQPLNKHYHLYEKVLYAIFEGYYARTPQSFIYDVNKASYDSETKESSKLRLKNAVTRGFSLIGDSGLGKTTAIDKILSLFPKKVYHQDCNINQIPYLKIDCPYDGSQKTICTSFFQQLDATLGFEHYSIKYTYRYSASSMLNQMRKLSSIYCIGLIVIDEIQNLKDLQKDGVHPLLNFLKQLSNELGVPICFIGTPEAKLILGGNYQLGRRSQGFGTLDWKRLNVESETESKDAVKFFSRLWELQVLREVTPPSANLQNLYFAVSQGIIDEMISLHIHVQRWAIDNQIEEITPDLIESVLNEDMILTQSILNKKSDQPDKNTSIGLPSVQKEQDKVAKATKTDRKPQKRKSRSKAKKSAQQKLVLESKLTDHLKNSNDEL